MNQPCEDQCGDYDGDCENCEYRNYDYPAPGLTKNEEEKIKKREIMKEIKLSASITIEDLAKDLNRGQADELVRSIDDFQGDWEFTLDMSKYFLSQLFERGI